MYFEKKEHILQREKYVILLHTVTKILKSIPTSKHCKQNFHFYPNYVSFVDDEHTVLLRQDSRAENMY